MALCLMATAALGLFAPESRAAQSKLDPHLRIIRSASKEKRRTFRPLMAVDPDGPVPTVDVFIRFKPGSGKGYLERAYPQAQFRSELADVVTARIPIALLEALDRDPGIEHVQQGRKLAPVLDIVRSSTTSGGLFLGVLKNGLSDLAGADGSGVIVGVVDTGIDWSHKDFIKDAPNTSRILDIWDQTISPNATFPNPSGFGYGAEITGAQITSKLQTGNPNIPETDSDGHGTHVTGIAAGDGTATNGNEPAGKYAGMAPNADIISVKSDLFDSQIIDGMNYIVGKAQALGKRAVINLSLGGQNGPHDGTDAFETGVAAIAANTPVAVAAGNDQADNPHAGLVFSPSAANTFIVNNVSAGEFIDTEFWHPSGDSYKVTVTTCAVCTVSVAADPGSDASGSIGSAAVSIFNGTNTGHPLGDKQIFVEIDQTPSVTASAVHYKLERVSNGGSGRVDGYTQPAILGTEFASFVDPTGTATEPAAANNVIAVGAYNSKSCWKSVDTSNYCYTAPTPLGLLASFSGRGPTRDGRLKPEIAAPGQGIAASLSADSSPSIDRIIFDGRHRINQGTSQATPVVAGFVALKLQVNPAATLADVHAAIQANARVDNAVLAFDGQTPNNAWGYGKLLGTPMILASPQDFAAATQGTSSITWTWASVINALSYNVYYSTNNSSFIANVPAPSFTFANLPSNFLTGIFVKGVNVIGQGPGGTSPSTATLALAITGTPALTAHVSSITVSYTPCPASPPSCSGYVLNASTASNFSGIVISSATPDRALGTLVVSGLSTVTTYYLRLATLNASNGPNFTSIGSIKTLTSLLPPAPAPFSNISRNTIQLNWQQGGNPAGTSYSADVSTDSNFAGTLLNMQGQNIFSALFANLSANTSYYFRVQGLPEGPYLYEGPAATLAADPAAVSPAFSDMAADGLTAHWSSGANPAGTLYLAQVSTASNFTGTIVSSHTRNSFAGFAGLSFNTTYYARAQAISHGGTATSFVTLSSTPTLAQAPSALAQTFSGQFRTGFTAGFTDGGNPQGTLFLAKISTSSGFTTVSASSLTLNAFAQFSGLIPNQIYYFTAAALNRNGAPSSFLAASSTVTLPAPPAAAAQAVSNQTTAALRMSWSGNGNSSGTLFTAQISPDPLFGSNIQSSTTANRYADFAGLSANTTYSLRVETLSLGPPNPDSDFVSLGGGPTLADPPAPAVPAIVSVSFTSVTVQWIPLPGAPPEATCEGYRVDLSTDPGFGGALLSKTVPGSAASQAAVGGLVHSTTYYLRLGSLNWNAVPNFIALGSTRTLIPNLVFGNADSSGLDLIILSPFAPLLSIGVDIPPGVFPLGTAVTLNTSVQLDLPPPGSNQARISALGPGLGFSLSAGGLQPNGIVRITLVYDPLLLPAGTDPRDIQLFRYDETAGQWSLLPTSVDTLARTILAQTDHFSFFAPFAVAPAAGLDSVNLFPIPWEPGSGHPLFDAQNLTISNLPADAGVRIFNISGELVWEGRAGGNGILNWRGTNRFGRPAGSGTYLVVIEGGGQRIVRRAVLIR